MKYRRKSCALAGTVMGFTVGWITGASTVGSHARGSPWIDLTILVLLLIVVWTAVED